MLRQHAVAFTEHIYDYVEHGGTAESARQLGVDEHAVVKTLVMQDQDASERARRFLFTWNAACWRCLRSTSMVDAADTLCVLPLKS